MSARRTIMLVEDDRFVLSVMQRVIEKLGFEVLSFSRPAAAAIYLRTGDAPALLITDVIMPGMNGFELCDVLRTRFPAVPVIFASGYPLEDLPDAATVLPGNSCFITKPLGIDLVRTTITDILAENGVGSAV